jgi:hypothetical protein
MAAAQPEPWLRALITTTNNNNNCQNKKQSGPLFPKINFNLPEVFVTYQTVQGTSTDSKKS